MDYQEAREQWFRAYRALLCAVHCEATGCPNTALIHAIAPYVVAYPTEGGVAVASPPTVTEALAALQAASEALAETDDEYQQRTRRFIDCLAFHADPDGSGANVADLGPSRRDAYGWSVDGPVEVRRHDEFRDAHALALELSVGVTPEQLPNVLALSGALALLLMAPPARHGENHVGRKATAEGLETVAELYARACQLRRSGIHRWAAVLAEEENPAGTSTEQRRARKRIHQSVTRYAAEHDLVQP